MAANLHDGLVGAQTLQCRGTLQPTVSAECELPNTSLTYYWKLNHSSG